ncbi:MAG: hypothetical protein SFY32_02440 [Bacteroidota bacterium]|nr:hypothetical protein [Bacteroidota bacterium]
MEAILFIWPLGIIFLALPLMTGWVAKTEGRNFWLWTGLTCLLPGITLILLIVLPKPKKSTAQAL